MSNNGCSECPSVISQDTVNQLQPFSTHQTYSLVSNQRRKNGIKAKLYCIVMKIVYNHIASKIHLEKKIRQTIRCLLLWTETPIIFP